MVFGPTLRKVLPYVNFVVATSALGFQYFVLYPWHNELDQDFQVLKAEQRAVLEDYHKKKLERLEQIENDIHRLESKNIFLGGIIKKEDGQVKGKDETFAQ